jgi:hypothetical protein
MKVMVKSIQLGDLPTIFVSDFSLDIDNARKLTAELKEKLFFVVSNYLGYNASYSSVMPKVAPISEISIPDRVIKESGIIFAGADLGQRFKAVLDTYIKGIRSRIDTRITLSKEIISGGLGLDHKTIDKIFNICDRLSRPQEETVSSENTNTVNPKSGLEKIRALYEQPTAARDIPYDLSAAIAKGEIKKPEAPFSLPIPIESKEKMLSEPAEELKLEAPGVVIPTAPTVVPVPEPVAKTRFTSEVKKPATVNPQITSELKMPVSETPQITKPIENNIPVQTRGEVSQGIEAITPIAPPKIVKPVEKVSLWSKLFGKKEMNMEIKSMPKPAIPPVNASISNSSVAARRMEAAASLRAESPKSLENLIVKPKQIPRVMSPIDELKYLDLVNFRRLGASPAEAISKIDSKIKLLEKDGYEKKIGGIMAWKQSPVNKIYLKMGQDALKKGESLKDYALAAKKNNVTDLLSWEEIELIIKLNNQFMF